METSPCVNTLRYLHLQPTSHPNLNSASPYTVTILPLLDRSPLEDTTDYNQAQIYRNTLTTVYVIFGAFLQSQPQGQVCSSRPDSSQTIPFRLQVPEVPPYAKAELALTIKP